MRSAIGLAMASVLLALAAPGCVSGDEAEDLANIEAASVAAEDELAFLDRAYDTFVAQATDAMYAPLRDTKGSTDPTSDMSSYYRTTCSLALVGALHARVHGGDPPALVMRWIERAIDDYPHFAEDAWGRHVRYAPAVDCLLAASAAAPWLAPAAHARLRAAVAVVADSAPSPADYRAVGKANPGNSQAEESALAADLLYLASALAAPSAKKKAEYRDRSLALFRYAASIPKKGAPYAGEAFRGTGTDPHVVTNHGLEPSPYYSLGALLSYADATAVARSLGERLPPGIAATKTTTEAGDQLGVREIFAGSLRRLDRGTFGFTGGYRLVGEKGDLDVRLDYGAQTQTIPYFPPNEELLIPTRDVGTVSQFSDPLDGKVKGYQIDGDAIRAFECADEPRGWFCRARFKAKLSAQWAGVADQGRFGGHAMPAAGVDAMPQWIGADGTLSTEVFAGGRVWRYDCSGSPRTCRAIDSRDLRSHYLAYGFSSSSLPPTDRVDAATSFVHLDGTGRRYWVRGDEVWRARCNADFTGCAVSSDTLEGQLRGLSLSPALPTDRVDALVQFVRGGVLSTYVYRGDRIWKYDCTTSACTPRFTQRIEDQWRGITNQERWADRTLVTLRGVTDWGVQATMMNATFALARVLGVDAGAYADLLSVQRDDLHLATQPLLPATFDPKSGAFGWGAFRGAAPVGRYGVLSTLEDGWLPRHLSPLERLDSFTFLNAFAARNHAVAWALTSGAELFAPL